MSILDQIIKDKKIEVSKEKNIFLLHIGKLLHFLIGLQSLSDNLRKSKSGIIAEFKDVHPSKIHQ